MNTKFSRFGLFLLGVLSLGLAGCGSQHPTESVPDLQPATTQQADAAQAPSLISELVETGTEATLPMTGGNKTAVVYFSRAGENYSIGIVATGNTEIMASFIADTLKADLLKIFPVVDYPENYSETLQVVTKERESNARPAFNLSGADLSAYDTIFLGYPIWYRDIPMIVYNFLETYDFSGKKIIPFNTHEGSQGTDTYDIIATKLPSAQVITDGLAMYGSIARTDKSHQQILDRLQKLGYTQ